MKTQHETALRSIADSAIEELTQEGKIRSANIDKLTESLKRELTNFKADPVTRGTIASSKLAYKKKKELIELATQIHAAEQKFDTRDETTKALDKMYGAGNWDDKDREDFEG